LLAGIAPLRPEARFLGTCDLVLEHPTAGARKFSGNSLRVGRNWMLYHGTLLVDMNLELIARLLNHPPREPEYRAGRPHTDFLTNLQVEPQRLIESLRHAWQAHEELADIPVEVMRRLVNERYSQASWNYQR
jgi:lipoate-protein ligase A